MLFGPASGTACDEPVEEPVGHRDDGMRTLLIVRRVASRDGPVPAGVLDVLSVRGDDERRAPADGGEQPRRDEEVRVHDVGPEPSRRPHDVECEPRVAAAAAAPVDDRAREIVAAGLQLPFQRGDERAEARRIRTRIHLRDEQDPHARSLLSAVTV